MNQTVTGKEIGNLLSMYIPQGFLDFSWDLWRRVTGFNGGLVWKRLILAGFRDTGQDQKKPVLELTVALFCPLG